MSRLGPYVAQRGCMHLHPNDLERCAESTQAARHQGAQHAAACSRGSSRVGASAARALCGAMLRSEILDSCGLAGLSKLNHGQHALGLRRGVSRPRVAHERSAAAYLPALAAFARRVLPSALHRGPVDVSRTLRQLLLLLLPVSPFACRIAIQPRWRVPQ